jgi:hypothetical protein
VQDIVAVAAEHLDGQPEGVAVPEAEPVVAVAQLEPQRLRDRASAVVSSTSSQEAATEVMGSTVSNRTWPAGYESRT